MEHEKMMRYAIELAKKGSGYVHPNPLVACVIVKDGEIISEGYHEYFGGAHAEVNAIQSLERKGFREWDKVMLYVTLEPCNHYGKTPPCTNLILEKGIKKVVVATLDPNPLVAGKGIAHLEKHRVSVIKGIAEQEARELNKRFFTFHLKRRPYILLKWAVTKDGFISKLDFKSREENIISSNEALKMVHVWRSEEQSILVGFNTVLRDNPFLNVRFVEGKNPVKIILDKGLNLESHALNVFKGKEKIIVFNALRSSIEKNVQYIKIDWDKKEEQILQSLYELNIVSVLIEGGSKTLQAFLDKDLWDEIRIIKSKHKIFNAGITAPKINILHSWQYEEVELKEEVIQIFKR